MTDGCDERLCHRASIGTDVETPEAETPEAETPEAERRVTAPGRRSDDGRRCELLVVWERDGSWSVHAPPPGSAGVRMTADIAASLAAWVLARAR